MAAVRRDDAPLRSRSQGARGALRDDGGGKGRPRRRSLGPPAFDHGGEAQRPVQAFRAVGTSEPGSVDGALERPHRSRHGSEPRVPVGRCAQADHGRHEGTLRPSLWCMRVHYDSPGVVLTRPVHRAIVARLVIFRLRSQRRNCLLARGARIVVALLILPALLIAPIANGGAVLFHSHGHSHAQDHEHGNGHAHVLPSALAHGPSHALDDWHHEEHEPANHDRDDPCGDPAPDRRAPATPPTGLLLKLSWSILPRSELRSCIATPVFQLALAFTTETTFDLRANRHAWREPVLPPRAGSPGRSGVAAVLRSSHALLI